jgi:proteasome lid subunit RPN8/RPN11
MTSWLEEIKDIDVAQEGTLNKKDYHYGNVDNEISLTLLGCRMGRFWIARGHWGTEGVSARVEINPVKVLEREEKKGDIIGFWHTHPNMSASPSYRDYLTMRGWWISFGKPLVCCIHGNDGLKAHWFFDDESDHVSGPVKRWGNWFFGTVPKRS